MGDTRRSRRYARQRQLAEVHAREQGRIERRRLLKRAGWLWPESL